jgi:hypothetical protein
VYAHSDPTTVVPPFEEARGDVRRAVLAERRAALTERLRRDERVVRGDVRPEAPGVASAATSAPR